MPKLYRAFSILNNIKGYDGVAISWLCSERRTPIGDYQDFIKNFNPEDKYAIYLKGYIDELFTSEEVEQLKKYFFDTHGEKVYANEEILPIDAKSEYLPAPLGAIPLGSKNGSFLMDTEHVDLLPFIVFGYYDIRPYMS